jgi:hypothetical protein
MRYAPTRDFRRKNIVVTNSHGRMPPQMDSIPSGRIAYAHPISSVPFHYPFIPNNRIALPPKIFSLSASEIPFIALIGAMVLGQVEIASP